MAASTKDRLLDVAERLFAERGFPATSLRDITSEARVNVASVNYHFGSKESLLGAVLERRLRPINERRLTLLDAIETAAADHHPDLEEVLRAFLAPPFHKQQEWGERGQNFLHLMGRVHSEVNDEFRASFLQQFETVRNRFAAALQRALPHLGPTDIAWRMLFLVGSMAFTMMWGDSLVSIDQRAARDPEDILESLIQYAAAGMASAVTTGVRVSTSQKGAGL